MKYIAILFTAWAAAHSVSAYADFISLPIKCSVLSRAGDNSDIVVTVGARNGDAAIAHLQDGGDEAELWCRIVNSPSIEDEHNLVCRGRWRSDGSQALLEFPLSTYVPMTAIRRSSGTHNRELQDGICTQI